jgi:response regulator RpfG family c-di-GMP phosphodiesterase
MLSAQGLDHVLFVDDDPRIQKAFRRLMAQSAVPAVTVSTGREALAEIEADPLRFGAVVSDLKLEEGDGLQVLQATAERAPWASRILVSGQMDLETALEAVKRCRVSRLLTKPWSLEELRDAVREGIDRAFLGLRTSRALAERRSQSDDTQTVHLDALTRLRPLLERLAQWSGSGATGSDPRTDRLARYALEMARAMDLDARMQEQVELGALLHQVGKLRGVDDGGTEGTQSLSTETALAGQELLGGVEALRPVAEIVGQHRERFDGLGEPRGLARDEICLGARLVRLVEVFDMVTGWPRTAEAVEKGRVRVTEEAGTQLDPQLVRVFERVPVVRWIELS